MLDESLGCDATHCVVCVMNAFAAVVAERKGQGLSDLFGGGGAKVWRICHA